VIFCCKPIVLRYKKQLLALVGGLPFPLNSWHGPTKNWLLYYLMAKPCRLHHLTAFDLTGKLQCSISSVFIGSAIKLGIRLGFFHPFAQLLQISN
jgi:hypothetical protein